MLPIFKYRYDYLLIIVAFSIGVPDIYRQMVRYMLLLSLLLLKEISVLATQLGLKIF